MDQLIVLQKMESNGYLRDAVFWLIVLVPALLVFWKIAFPEVSWWLVILISIGGGWILTISYFEIIPLNMGFGGIYALLYGWTAALPSLGFFALLYLNKPLRNTRCIKRIALALLLLALALPIVACARWLPEDEAIGIAMRKVALNSHWNLKFDHAKRTWNGWTVNFRDSGEELYPLYLSRSGHYLGSGG